MTKNQLTAGLVVACILVVILMADSAQKTATINAQRQQVNDAESARAKASTRASIAEAQRDRYLSTIGDLELKLKAVMPPAGTT